MTNCCSHRPMVVEQIENVVPRSRKQDSATRRIDLFVSLRDFSGVLLVAGQKAYGMASREPDAPTRVGRSFGLSQWPSNSPQAATTASRSTAHRLAAVVTGLNP